MIACVLALTLAAAEDNAPRNYLVPAVETEALHFALLGFNNFVTNESFARISLDSIASHFDGRRGWTFDTDTFVTNQFGHPYQGALTFTASRSAGLGFWWSSLYTFTASLIWELFFETDGPSVNDQITTSMGGVFLGEVLHRTAAVLFSGNLFEQVLAWIVDPLGTFNRWLLRCECDTEMARQPSSFGILYAGFSTGQLRDATTGAVSAEPARADFALLLSEGPDPRDPTPFSYFDFSARFAASQPPVANLFVRGLLAGRTYAGGHGVYGAFGQYDFAQAAVTRASAVGVGGGTYLQWRFSPNVFLQTTGLVSAVPFGAVGRIGQGDPPYRDYHIGPGGEALLELRLIHRSVGMVRAVAREWLVVGAYTPPSGFESMTYLSLGLTVKLLWRIGASLDLDASFRSPRFQDVTYNRGVRGQSLRLALVYFTDDVMGTD